jgi:hypothetical protein
MEVKEAPARGLRAVFAGFGRALGGRRKSGVAPTAQAETTSENGHVKVVASEAAAQETAVPETVVAKTATPEAKPQAAAAETATPETVAPETVVAKTAAPKAKTAAPKAKPQAAAAETATPETGASDAELPLANYDALTVASLRARLRTLTVSQLQILIDYEKAHLGREEVTGMFERRIAKIVAGETTSFPAIS